MPAPKIFVSRVATKIPEVADLSAHFKAAAARPAIKSLSTHLASQGFKPVTAGKDAYFGVTEKYTSNDGRTATFEIRLQSYQKGGSKDRAAVGTVTVRAGTHTDTYNFNVVAPNGKFQQAVEYTVDASNNLKKAKSWWSCWVACLKRSCVTTCLTSLVTCSGTWAAYFWCVVGRCGGCVTKCAGCCSCDCRWWCKWAAGCCNK